MILTEVIAAVHRYRERAQTQAQLARDIQHLREVARMLFEDKPDKTKAVEAVNDIAAKRLARMDAEALALLDKAPPISGGSEFSDCGDRLRWLMLVNLPGQFPYTQGIAEPGASGADPGTHTIRSRTWLATDVVGLATALAEGWCWLAAARNAGDGVEAQALQIAVAFDEHRDAEHRALGRAARRLWAIGLREHFGIGGDGSKLVLVTGSGASERITVDFGLGNHGTDQAEDAVLASLRTLVTPSMPD
ncbi:MAG: methylmalonyl-CoA mutase family protein [Burkholderiaceae bacterium]|nr:methylmalonyl-CoA mutase family protein [Burkholderiaceae bacterium]